MTKRLHPSLRGLEHLIPQGPPREPTPEQVRASVALLCGPRPKFKKSTPEDFAALQRRIIATKNP